MDFIEIKTSLENPGVIKKNKKLAGRGEFLNWVRYSNSVLVIVSSKLQIS